MSQIEVDAAPKAAVPSRAQGLLGFSCAATLFAVVQFMGPLIGADAAAKAERDEFEVSARGTDRIDRAEERKAKRREAAGSRSQPRGSDETHASGDHGGHDASADARDMASVEVLARGGDVAAQLEMWRSLVEADREEQSFHWLYRAAMQQHGDSMLEIARWYENGRAIRKSDLDAYAWYSNAEARGVAGGAASAHYIYSRLKPSRQKMADFRKQRLSDLLDEALARRGESSDRVDEADGDGAEEEAEAEATG